MSSSLSGKKIVIGITGSIAAYKIPYLVRLLVKEGANVRVIMTPVAKDFVTPLTLATLSTNPVIIEPFDPGSGTWSNHVELGQWADLMLFAPVTANTMAKMVSGMADNFLVTAYLSAKCPVLIAPAMDLDMYNHPSTRKNVELLRSFGNSIIEPQVGELASGLSGPGRLEEPENILRIIIAHFSSSQLLKGKKVLITAGPTYEKIDPVRFIGNFSTGKMGFALAEAARDMGAEVTLVAGPTGLETPAGLVKRIDVVSSSEMATACFAEALSADLIIMAAAVSDYTVRNPSQTKTKKRTGTLSLELAGTTDILSELGKKKRRGQVLVGFALESDHETEHAQDKLKSKALDFIILNSLKDKGAGFGYDTNKVTIFNARGIVHKGKLNSKKEVARDILRCITGTNH